MNPLPPPPRHSYQPLTRLGLVLLLACTACMVACENTNNGEEPEIDLQQMMVDLEMENEGGQRYVIISDANGEHRLTANEFLAALEASQTRQRERGWLFVVLNITTWAGVLWVTLGLSGQIVFTGRMVLQWLASEQAGRSVVPNLFWWMSLIGASMLLVYFFWRKDIVGILGQGAGWVIYARNLWLIHRSAHRNASQPHTVAAAQAKLADKHEEKLADRQR